MKKRTKIHLGTQVFGDGHKLEWRNNGGIIERRDFGIKTWITVIGIPVEDIPITSEDLKEYCRYWGSDYEPPYSC